MALKDDLEAQVSAIFKAQWTERDGQVLPGDIPVLDEAAIIPFKARAWLDLSRRRDAGEKIDEKDVKSIATMSPECCRCWNKHWRADVHT